MKLKLKEIEDAEVLEYKNDFIIKAYFDKNMYELKHTFKDSEDAKKVCTKIRIKMEINTIHWNKISLDEYTLADYAQSNV